MRDFIEILAVPLLGSIFVIFMIFALILSFAKSQTIKTCSVFQQQSGFNTKYVEYTYFNFDCLAEQTDGKWISTDNIYFNTQKPD